MGFDLFRFHGILLFTDPCLSNTTGKVKLMRSNTEVNLGRLAKTTLLKDFVTSHNGEWNHQDWLIFCASLEEKGYTPIDLDQVGLLLEKEKSIYWDNH